MNRIFLHAGHGKTGTSFIQSFLAKNVEVLAKNGIHYPIGKESQKAAAANETTSGNQAVLGSWLQKTRESFAVEGDLLFSGETIFKRLTEPDFLNPLLEVSQRYGKEVRIALFIRDPADYQVSAYLQRVQQGMCAKDIDRYFEEDAPRDQRRVFSAVSDVINCSAANGFELLILNYSREKKRIIEHLCSFLCLPGDLSLDMPDRLVNRSLGAVEVGAQLAILRSLSDYEGTKGANHLKRLVDTTASITRTPPGVKSGILTNFMNAVREETDAMNLSLPAGQTYQLDESSAVKDDRWNDEQVYGTQFALAVIQAALHILSKDDDSAAATKMRKVIHSRLTPSVSDRRVRAAALLNANSHADALPLLRELALETENPLDQYRLAKCLAALKDPDEAAVYARLCFSSRPDMSPNTLLLFNILIGNGAYSEAESLLRVFQKVASAEDVHQFLLGRLAFAQGKFYAAATAFGRAIALKPDNRSYVAWLKRIAK